MTKNWTFCSLIIGITGLERVKGMHSLRLIAIFLQDANATFYSPSLTHSRGMLALQPSVTLLTAHVSENFSKHTSLIYHFSFLPYAFFVMDTYVRQAIELRILFLIHQILLSEFLSELARCCRWYDKKHFGVFFGSQCRHMFRLSRSSSYQGHRVKVKCTET